MRDKILRFLNLYPNGKTPTEIGIGLGKDYNCASSSVAYQLKKLINEGFVIRLHINNRIIYKLK